VQSMFFRLSWVIMQLLRSAPASEEARRLVVPGGCGVRKKRSAIITCMAIETFKSPAKSSHLPEYVNTPAVAERNGDG
jgi:hypothetical protein